MSLMMVDSNLCFNYCMHVSIMIYLQAWPDLKLVWLHFDHIAFFWIILWQCHFHHQLHESHTQPLLTLRGDFHDLVPLEPPSLVSAAWHLGEQRSNHGDQAQASSSSIITPHSASHAAKAGLWGREGDKRWKAVDTAPQWLSPPIANYCAHPLPPLPPNCLHCPPAHCQTFKITKSPIDSLIITMSEILTLRQISLVIIWGDLKSLRFQWFHIFYWLWWSKRHHIPNGRQYFRR